MISTCFTVHFSSFSLTACLPPLSKAIVCSFAPNHLPEKLT